MKKSLTILYARGYKQFLFFVAPPICAHCKQFINADTILCANCLKQIMPVVSTIVPVTQKYSMKVFAIAAYKEPLKSLILAKGWSDQLASKQLAELMWQKTNVRHAPFDYIIPVALHWTRFAYRGFNQSEEIAHVLAKKSGKKVAHILCRIKRTQFQSGLTTEKRQHNVKNIFKLSATDKKLYHGKHLLLVDDLMTTGATLKSAARELIKLRPATISVVVACRTL